MSITPTPNVPSQPQDNYEAVQGVSTPRWIPILIVALFLGLGAVAYMGYTSRAKLQSDLATANSQTELLGKQLDQTNSRVALLRGQLDVTSQKLGLTQNELARARTLAQTIQAQQQEADAKLGEQSAQLGQVQQSEQASDQKITQVSTDLTGAKGDIDATRKDLAETKGKLTSTIGDLGVQSGLIARNHEDVEALRRLGERNIVDFNLTKSKKPQRVGPIQITLENTDPKRYRFTLMLLADDKSIEKKDRNVDEPMQFYVHGARAPYEIVVFSVDKTKATGYLSMPKDEVADAAPAAAAAPAPAKAASAPAPAAASNSGGNSGASGSNGPPTLKRNTN